MKLGTLELLELAEKDQCYQRIQAKIIEIQARPVPTPEQKKAAKDALVTSYWNWILMEEDEEERKELIKMHEGSLARRLIELRKKSELKKIYRIQKQLGYRFRPAMTSSAGPVMQEKKKAPGRDGVLLPGSPTKT